MRHLTSSKIWTALGLSGLVMSLFLFFQNFSEPSTNGQASDQAELPTFISNPNPVLHSLGFVRSKDFDVFLRGAPRGEFTNNAAAKAVEIPAQYSMEGITGPIENQGMCGDCWDFALTTTLRGSLKMKGLSPGRLSFNYLLSCYIPKAGSGSEGGCQGGGDFTAAEWLLSNLGSPKYGSDGAYDHNNPNFVPPGGCQAPRGDQVPVAWAGQYVMLGNGTNPSFRDIAYVLGVLHRPVTTDVTADSKWMNYLSGVYNACDDQNPADMNHMVVLEGYNCGSSVDSNGNCVFDKQGNLPPGIGSWIVRNSWGASFGENGYIRMKATSKSGERCNSIGTDALYFEGLELAH